MDQQDEGGPIMDRYYGAAAWLYDRVNLCMLCLCGLLSPEWFWLEIETQIQDITPDDIAPSWQDVMVADSLDEPN